MRRNTVVLGLLVAVWGNAVQAEGVSYFGTLSRSGTNTDGQLYVAGPTWNSSQADPTLSWSVDDTTTPGKWHYVYTLQVPGGSRRADIQCVILETTDAHGGQAFTAANLLSPASIPADWLVSTQIGWFDAGSEPGLPRDLYGVEFCTLTTDPTTLTISFDSDRDPMWGDLYARGFLVCDEVNLLYNAGMLSPNPTDAPRSGSMDGHLLVPDTGAQEFIIPAPSALLLTSLGAWLTRWLRRGRLRQTAVRPDRGVPGFPLARE